MKVYFATRGEYDSYRILRVFTTREDAEAYPECESVEEHEVLEGPAEVRDLFYAGVNSGGSEGVYVHPTDMGRLESIDPKPGQMEISRFDGIPFGSNFPGHVYVVTVRGWDRDQVIETARWHYQQWLNRDPLPRGEHRRWRVTDPFYKEEQ